jgi:hypothetical protein
VSGSSKAQPANEEDTMNPRQAITGAAAMLLLAGCGASAGQPSPMATVTGRFIREGGPLGPGGQQPAEQPLSGTVVFTAGRLRVAVQVGSSGTFSLRLPPGTYAVSGRSPSIVEVSTGTAGGQAATAATRETPCSVPGSVTVAARHVTRATVACIVP